MDLRDNDLIGFLRADLAAFADPGTEVRLNASGEFVSGAWQQDGRRKTATFLVKGAPDLTNVIVSPEGSDSPRSYAEFLASDRMGDLRALARNTLQVISPIAAYMAPSAQEPEQGNDGRADDVVRTIVSSRTDATRVVFITADAGVGKTSLLKSLVRESAADYIAGRTRDLWLYVNAQGSRLARLDQALAQTLDDLRARFPYHAADALVRTGSVVLVVDGFDELIGTQGSYDEAFSSLASFIGTLRGSGVIVAAARSAYYEQEFATRAGSSIGFPHDPWTLSLVTLNQWTEAERGQYLSRLAEVNRLDSGESDVLRSTVLATFEDPRVSDLASRPLLVSRVAELVLEGKSLESGGDLVERLVNTYVKREVTEKLLSPAGKPWLSSDQLREFYSEIAYEMWRQETRELSRTSLRELIEVVSEMHNIDAEGRMAIIERAPYSALIVGGGAPGSIAFEHDLYFAHFLTQPIVSAIRSLQPQTIALTLRKGQLPDQAGLLVGESFASAEIQPVLDAISTSAESVSTGAEQIRRNVGLIVAGVLHNRTLEDLQFRSLDFVDCDLSKSRMLRSRLIDCTLRGSDIRGAQWLKSSGSNLWFESVLADETTRLELAGVQPNAFLALRYHPESGQPRTLFSPDDLRTALETMGLPAAQSLPRDRSIDPEVVKVVLALARIYHRTNLVTPTDFYMKWLVDSDFWMDLEGLLKRHGIIEEEIRSSSGYKTFFRLMVRPRDLEAGQSPTARVDSRILAFWDELERHFPLNDSEATAT